LDTTGHPLDTIKTRIQTQAIGANLYRGLYRGILPPLIAITPAFSAVFVCYGVGLKLIGRDDLGAVALAGASCGFVYGALMCPFELVKVNAQRAQLSTADAFRLVVRDYGYSGLYRGFRACALRDTCQSSVRLPNVFFVRMQTPIIQSRALAP
jgi:hypothetical protein